MNRIPQDRESVPKASDLIYLIRGWYYLERFSSVVFLCLATICFVQAILSKWNTWTLKNHGVETTGQVVDVGKGSSGGGNVRIRFYDKTMQIVERDVMVGSNGVDATIRMGQSVAVRYIPSSPTMFSVNGNRFENHVQLSIMGFLFVVVAIGFEYWNRKRFRDVLPP
jgi:hypothetical protein